MINNYLLQTKNLSETPLFSSTLFSEFSPETKRFLQDHLTEIVAESGTKIIEIGDKAEGIYILLDGLSQISTSNGGSRLVESDEIIGLTEFITNNLVRSKFSALTNCRLQYFRGEYLSELHYREPEFRFKLLEQYSKGFQKSYLKLLHSAKS